MEENARMERIVIIKGREGSPYQSRSSSYSYVYYECFPITIKVVQ